MRAKLKACHGRVDFNYHGSILLSMQNNILVTSSLSIKTGVIIEFPHLSTNRTARFN